MTPGGAIPRYVGLSRSNAQVCIGRRNVNTLQPSSPSSMPVRVTPSAKIFDWKKRMDKDYGKIGGDGIFTLDNLRPAPGSRHRKKRKGRGHAAGQGGSCGFGMRGQKSRSGRSVRPGFEGGQTPLYRRLPKFVGRPMGPGHKKTVYALVKIDYLNECDEGAVVTLKTLQEKGVVTKQKRKLYKVVGGKNMDQEMPLKVRNLTVKAHAFTTSAAAAIERAGGTCVLISPTTGEDIVLEEDETIASEGESETEVVAEESESEQDVLEGSESEQVVLEEDESEQAVVEEDGIEQAVMEEDDVEQAVLGEADTEQAVVEEIENEQGVSEETEPDVVEESENEQDIVE